MIRLRMRANMEPRFLDREFGLRLSKETQVVFAISGHAVMLTARRTLRLAPQKTLSQMTRQEVATYRYRLEQWKRSGREYPKPRRPDKTSRPGNPPLLHSKRSALKVRLLFALAPDSKSVVIGPELLGINRKAKRGLSSVEQLEHWRPFMAPALDKVAPKIPSYIESARKKVGL